MHTAKQYTAVSVNKLELDTSTWMNVTPIKLHEIKT